MSGQLGFVQTSYNDWCLPARGMLHERAQAGAKTSPNYQTSAFEDLERQMAEQEIETTKTLDSLFTYFIFNNPEAITLFLKTHRAIAPVLLESVQPLRDCFGPESPLALDIMSDEGPPEAIYSLVLWRGARETARANLKRFDEFWWMRNMKKAGGRIVFDYELL